jgi:hypothetical protein
MALALDGLSVGATRENSVVTIPVGAERSVVIDLGRVDKLRGHAIENGLDQTPWVRLAGSAETLPLVAYLFGHGPSIVYKYKDENKYNLCAHNVDFVETGLDPTALQPFVTRENERLRIAFLGNDEQVKVSYTDVDKLRGKEVRIWLKNGGMQPFICGAQKLPLVAYLYGKLGTGSIFIYRDGDRNNLCRDNVQIVSRSPATSSAAAPTTTAVCKRAATTQWQ